MKLNTILPPLAFIASIQAASVVMTIYPQQTTTSSPAPRSSNNVVYVTRTRGESGIPISSSLSSSHDHDHDEQITSVTGQTTAITSCHYHEATQFCINGQGEEGSVIGAPTNTASGPVSYTSCHAHSAQETFCVGPDGDEVQFVAEGSEAASSSSSGSSGRSCHFHAGVEHCVGGDESEVTCERVDRDYDIPLRIGLLFVILVTSAIGAFGPILVKRLFNLSTEGIIFVIIKQFGTGVIISTAFVHLITHASLMWNNDCMKELEYEATGSAITMAGIFLAFFIEYLGNRAILWRSSKFLNKETSQLEKNPSLPNSNSEADSSNKNPTNVNVNNDLDHVHSHGLLMPKDKVSVLMMEMGIIFHSILIGITLVVAGDSSFITLFIVILFHQMFEGLALGSRVAELENTNIISKLLMAFVYSIITPIGMAIGIGVLSKFNGNDPSTLIALGTLDSFSAGVLIWTGLIEMWAHDWLFGKLAHANALKTTIAMFSLISGMLLMSVLGKWA